MLLIDKDAIFTAEGSAITTSGKLVIGQITPISGDWGIATNPESFADYGYTLNTLLIDIVELF